MIALVIDWIRMMASSRIGPAVDRGDAGGNHFGVAAPAQCYGTRHGTGLDMADQKPFQLGNHVSGGGRAGR